MKNVIRFLSLTALLLLAGCNSSDAYKEQVNVLNQNWGTTTDDLIALGKTAEGELSAWKEMYEGMYTMSDEERMEMDDTQKQTLDSLDAVCKSHGDKYTLMNQEISELRELWVQNTGIVEDINQKFADNSLTEEHLKAIDQLTEQSKDVNEQIATWKGEMENIKKECLTTCQAYANNNEQD